MTVVNVIIKRYSDTLAHFTRRSHALTYCGDNVGPTPSLEIWSVEYKSATAPTCLVCIAEAARR